MKSTKAFKETIQSYLDQRAQSDPLFAPNLAKPNKNIDGCITYILNTVQKSGCNGFADDEIYSMAVHYYDEDDLVVGKPIDGRVVVNHTVELTEEDIQEAKQKAIAKLHEEVYQSMKRRPSKSKVCEPKVKEISLFE